MALVLAAVAQRLAVGAHHIVGPGDADDDVLPAHARARGHQTVLVELRVVAELLRVALVVVRPLEAHALVVPPGARLLRLLLLEDLEVRGAEEAIVVRRHVLDQGVLLVVPRVDHDADDGVEAAR
jgi:hypothetical protein